MKKVSLLCTGFLLFLCPLFYGSCDEDENELPPITMEGKNTFGCLVNGKVWLPKGRAGSSGFFADMTINNFLSILADNDNSGVRLILSDKIGIQANKIYTFKNDTTFNAEYYKSAENITCFYKYTHLIYGKIQLSKLEAEFISGTFEFTTYNPDCGDTIKVTQGRFDIGEITK